MRRNPTVHIKLYQLQYHLERLAHNYPQFGNFLLAVEGFPGRFTKDEFVNLILTTICPEGEVRSTLEKKRQDLLRTAHSQQDALLFEKCQNIIAEILHYYILQHPVDRSKLSWALDDYIANLQFVIDKVYATSPQASWTFGDYLIHLENILTASKTIDPYQINMLSLNRHLDKFSFRGSSDIIVSLALVTNAVGLGDHLNYYFQMADDICKLLNPFKDVRIYSYKDLHDMNHIFPTEMPSNPNMLMF